MNKGRLQLCMNNDNIRNKSSEKAFKVLECFKVKPVLGITEISVMTGMNKSNVHDYLMTLVAMGYARQDVESAKYSLGYKVLDLSYALTSSMGFRRTVYPTMQRLANASGESVYYAIPDGSEVLYLDAAYPSAHMQTPRSLLGERAELYCTALGKAILSRYTVEEQIEKLKGPFTSYTPNTLTTLEDILRDVEETRKRNYAIDNMEHEYGIKCVAMPICNAQNHVMAAISVSGPSLRFTEKKIEEFVGYLISATEEIRYFY